ncbi:hypothetical protein [Pararhizobium sp.]|uniref:hypothetical protein n=1 Tax=Pararhizobium sp. TaxID=1977563 RepID=UPI002727EF1C|nr:hypothetical protein [Pararhizobium sp.]MDO9416223.1 hypothetical protein [Pararhizobium sp.]
MPNTTVPAAGEATPTSNTKSLMKAIYQYRSDWNGYMAATIDDDNAPLSYEPAVAVLETWCTPAEDWLEATMALELAVEFYELGKSDVIPAMMKAVLGWFEIDRQRRIAS